MKGARALRISITFDANSAAVRRTLARLRQALRAEDLCEADCGRVETVLAEAMNNVVEHAYGESGKGQMTVTLRGGQTRIIATLRDWGQPLSDLQLPAGERPALATAPCDLPEGGFGWFLIRTLCDSVRYRRDGDANCLVLHINRTASSAAG